MPPTSVLQNCLTVNYLPSPLGGGTIMVGGGKLPRPFLFFIQPSRLQRREIQVGWLLLPLPLLAEHFALPMYAIFENQI